MADPRRKIKTAPVLVGSPVLMGGSTNGRNVRVISVSNITINGLVFSFQLSNATLFIAARIRDIILTDIPTMAVDCVEIIKNASILLDENLAQLLSLVVFNSNNVGNFSPSSGCEKECLVKFPCMVEYRSTLQL